MKIVFSSFFLACFLTYTLAHPIYAPPRGASLATNGAASVREDNFIRRQPEDSAELVARTSTSLEKKKSERQPSAEQGLSHQPASAEQGPSHQPSAEQGPSHPGPSHPGPSHPGPAHPGPSHPGPSHPGPAHQPSAHHPPARQPPLRRPVPSKIERQFTDLPENALHEHSKREPTPERRPHEHVAPQRNDVHSGLPFRGNGQVYPGFATSPSLRDITTTDLVRISRPRYVAPRTKNDPPITDLDHINGIQLDMPMQRYDNPKEYEHPPPGLPD